jgi:hypothetical protein
MSSRLRTSLSLLGVVAFLVCALLIIYFPAVPKTLLGWVALVFVGLPVWFALEWMGTVVLGAQFFARLSRPMRILLAIPVLAVLMVLAVVLGKFVQVLISSF